MFEIWHNAKEKGGKHPQYPMSLRFPLASESQYQHVAGVCFSQRWTGWTRGRSRPTRRYNHCLCLGLPLPFLDLSLPLLALPLPFFGLALLFLGHHSTAVHLAFHFPKALFPKALATGTKSKKNKKGLGLHVPTEEEVAGGDGEIKSSPLSALGLAQLNQATAELDEAGTANPLPSAWVE